MDSPVTLEHRQDTEALGAPVYSPIARQLHWWVAVLLVVQIPLGLYMAFRGNTLNLWDDGTSKLYSSHKLIGLIILVLMLTRLGYRFIHGTPPDEPSTTAWQRAISHVNYWLLYLLVIGVAIGGYIGVSLYPALDVFGVRLPAIVSPNKEAAAQVFYWHMLGALGILLLVGLHVSAATYHYYDRKDGVLRRMLVRAGFYPRT